MKKLSKLTSILLLFFLSLVLIGCNSTITKTKTRLAFEKILESNDFTHVDEDLILPLQIDDVEIEYRSTNTNILTHDGKITQSESDKKIILYITLTYKDEKLEKKVEVTVLSKHFEFDQPLIPGKLNLLQDILIKEEVTIGLPSNGDVKALIIPIDFVDYRYSSKDIQNIETAFFGTPLETGWESVNSYYKKSSYGKLNITGTITDIYSSNQKSSYYTNLYNDGKDADYILIKEALRNLDSKINYSDYDLNDDGYIDALYFIYSSPVIYDEEDSIGYEADLWWAYVYQYFTEYPEYYDGVEANYYLWAGADFMDEAFTYTQFTDKYITINSSTYIHETGHMLGLDDYYDYDETIGPKGGLGGADMMDYTIGDHSSFSKIMMNWTKPYVTTSGDYEITIKPFESSGDVILVSNNWKDSYFDEYFLIDYYTPTGLNKDHSGFNGLFSESGIRIYHINSIVDPTKGKPLNEEGYFTVFSYNNSDTNYKLISLIEADGNNSIQKSSTANNSDLFKQGDIFGDTSHKGYKLHNNETINFIVYIKSITPTEATIRITYNTLN